MRCPSCSFPDTKVVDSRSAEDGAAIRRRRECLSCGFRFTTYERIGEAPLIVIKRDGSSEVFDHQKLLRGLLSACTKRPVSHDQLEALINSIELDLASSQQREITSSELGNKVMAKLASIDEVAYIRFMSVYKDFGSVDEFAGALKDIS